MECVLCRRMTADGSAALMPDGEGKVVFIFRRSGLLWPHFGSYRQEMMEKVRPFVCSPKNQRRSHRDLRGAAGCLIINSKPECNNSSYSLVLI